MNLATNPFLHAIAQHDRVLLAGAGGGYDILAAMPLYFCLRGLGRQVRLANLSFTSLSSASGRAVADGGVIVTADSEASGSYFPERYLCEHLSMLPDHAGEPIEVCCFLRAPGSRAARPQAVARATNVLR